MKTALLLCAAAALGAAQDPYTQSRADGPSALIIAYRCNPDQRTTLRVRMEVQGVARFEGWKKKGVLKDYHILFNSYLDSETYDMLALLTFDKYADVARWREIEKESPGGLFPDVLPLITSAVTTPLDLARTGAPKTPATRGKSVWFLIPYDYVVSTDDYVKYLDTYVIPQTDGWIGENVLASYSMYISRYSTGRAWSSLFVLEYRDAAAFGLREATVAKVRAKLKSNPAWLAASENKQKIRTEKQTIIAEELLPR
jgi:hypothetical protein